MLNPFHPDSWLPSSLSSACRSSACFAAWKHSFDPDVPQQSISGGSRSEDQMFTLFLDHSFGFTKRCLVHIVWFFFPWKSKWEEPAPQNPRSALPLSGRKPHLFQPLTSGVRELRARCSGVGAKRWLTSRLRDERDVGAEQGRKTPGLRSDEKTCKKLRDETILGACGR